MLSVFAPPCSHRISVASAQPQAPSAQPSESAAQPNGAAQLASPQPPPNRPPFPNRANEVMPSWLRVRGEFRERVEGFSNSGFVDERDDAYFLSRVRLTATATGKQVAATVQVQDARVGGKSVGPTGAPFKSAFDLRQGFVDIGSAKAKVALRAGRQEIAFGDQRLVGHAGWLNAARSFDAARVTFRTAPAQVDVFAASVVRTLPDEFDKSGNGNRFAGAYVSSGRLLPLATAEPYVFYRRDTNQRAEGGSFGSLEQVTTGARLDGKLPARLDYNVEMDLQRGSLGPDSVRAWAGHWQIRESLAGPGVPRITAEYNFASGDADPADAVRGTFDQLYPTAHDKYGLADQVGWRNIHDVRLGFEVTPFKATPIAAQLPLLLARRKAGRPLCGERRAARARDRRRRERPGRAGDRHPGITAAVPAAGVDRRIRPPLCRAVPQTGDARRVLQRPVCDGDLCVPGGEVR